MTLYLCTASLYLCTASLYLEKVVTSKQLKFAMDTDVERKARLGKMVATTQLRLAPGDGGRKKSKKFRFDINFSSMGTIFLVVCMYVGMSSIVYGKTKQKKLYAKMRGWNYVVQTRA